MNALRTERRHRPSWTAATVALAVGLAGLAPLFASVAASQAPQTARVGPMPGVAVVDRGMTTTVEILVADIAELYGADVRLTFDPRYIEVVDADPHTAGTQIHFRDTFLSPDFTVRKVADNELGTIWYAASQVSPSEAVSGSGPIAAVTLRGRLAGTSAISVTYQKLVRRNGNRIDTMAEHGSITVLEDGTTATPGATPTRLAPLPVPTVTPSPTVTEPTSETKTIYAPLVLKPAKAR